MGMLDGRTVLLAGSSRGIGAATAAALGAAGARLIAHYRSDRIAAERATAGIPDNRLKLLAADFAQPGSAQALWSAAVSWAGRVDTLICNAAMVPSSPLDDRTDGSDLAWEAAWDTAYRVNVRQPATLIRDAVSHFRANGGGTIIVLSSWAAQRGAANPELGAYTASKAALAAFAKTMARAHVRDGVLVYVVAPGVVDTEMSAESALAQGGSATVAAGLAMGELVPPRELADLITFLATGTQRHLSGATLDVNGASYIR